LPVDLVADPQLVLADQRVVDPVDRVVPELAVVQPALELLVGDPVLEPEGLEEVLVDDVRPGRHDRVDHVVADHVDEHLLHPGRHHRPGQGQDDPAVAVAEHPLVDVGRPVQVAAAERQLAHRLDEAGDLRHRLDVDVLDRPLEVLALVRARRGLHRLGVERRFLAAATWVASCLRLCRGRDRPRRGRFVNPWEHTHRARGRLAERNKKATAGPLR
jgi:hypothetical protein